MLLSAAATSMVSPRTRPPCAACRPPSPPRRSLAHPQAPERGGGVRRRAACCRYGTREAVSPPAWEGDTQSRAHTAARTHTNLGARAHAHTHGSSAPPHNSRPALSSTPPRLPPPAARSPPSQAQRSRGAPTHAMVRFPRRRRLPHPHKPRASSRGCDSASSLDLCVCWGAFGLLSRLLIPPPPAPPQRLSTALVPPPPLRCSLSSPPPPGPRILAARGGP